MCKNDRVPVPPPLNLDDDDNEVDIELQEEEEYTHADPLLRVGRFWSLKPLQPKAYNCLVQIEPYYSDDDILESMLVPFCTESFPVALRVLNWLVTNYSKQYKIIITDPKSGVPFNIYDSYQTTGKLYKRSLFDPFRRKSKGNEAIYFQWKKDILETTVGQLNFLRWAQTSGVIDFALKHKDAISENYDSIRMKSRKSKEIAKQLGIRKKRSNLTSKNPVRGFVYTEDVMMKFEG